MTMEIGYRIARTYWGNGYATESVNALTKFAFEELQLEKINSSVIDKNSASVRVMEKCGYKLEGHIRKTEFDENKNFLNRCHFGIIKEEYRRTL